MSEGYQTLSVALVEDGRVLDVELGGGKGNILSLAMMDELQAAFAEHADRRGLHMVLLRGAGGHFSFGAAVEEHRREQAPAMLAGFRELCRTLAAFPVPIVAAVDGRCLGGAFEVALCAHVVLATPRAVFACPEIKLGVYPPVLAAIGAHRLGGATMERLLLTGGDLGAAEAHRLGFVAELLDGEDPVRDQALGWYGVHFAGLSAFSLRQATAAAREAGGLLALLGAPLERAEQRYLEHLLPSHDGNEGIDAFLARRKPVWTDA